MVTSDSRTREAKQLPLLRLFKLHPGEAGSRMGESRGGQHGMRDALPPPGFVSSVPGVPAVAPGRAEAHRALSSAEPGGSNGPTLSSSHSRHLQRQPPPPAALSTERDTRRSACGSEQETGLTSRPGPTPAGARNPSPRLERRLSGLYRPHTALGMEDKLVWCGGRMAPTGK